MTKHLPALLFGALALGAPLNTLYAGPDWAHENSDIKVDPNLVTGEMENGMRYMILKNAEPPGKVSLRMHFAAGSLMEAENQRGVAHFLEHMVFNGSKNFKPGELIPKMQRMGLGFGGHANAYTSFDETVYMLDLPTVEEDMLDLSFTIMRDFADGALLLKDEVDKERGVIIKELESRDSVESRMQEKAFQKLFKGSLVPDRFPIGTREVITGADRQRFVEFYQDYYVPDRTTFIVVGDIDPKAIEARIKKTFGSIKPAEKLGADPDLGKIVENGNEVFIVTDEEASTNDIEFISHQPYVERPDTVATRTEDLPLQLANAMLNRRFSRLAKKESAKFTSASAGYSEFFKAGALASLSVTANTAEDWEACLQVGEQELRRAIEHGFLESELEEIKADLLSSAENAVKSVETRQSAGLAMALVGSLDGEVFTRPEEDLRILKLSLEKLDIAQCQAALKKVWNFEELDIMLSGQPALEVEPATVLEVLKTSQAVEVAPKEAKELASFAYESFGDTGKVVKTETFDDLGIKRLHFENGLVVNLKQTDFSKNSISIQARFGHGKMSMPKDKPGLDVYSGPIFNGGGLEAHSAEDLQRIFAGKQVGVGLGIEQDHFTLSGRTQPEDLELQMKLMVAQLLHPGYREEAERGLDRQLPAVFQQLKHTPNGIMSTEVIPVLAGGDPRFVFPEMEALLAMTPEDTKAWLSDPLKNAPIELNVVGDFEEKALIDAIAKTFGALDKRGDFSAQSKVDKSLKMPVGGELKKLEFDSKVDRGFSMAVWNLGDDEDYQRARRLNVLGEVLGDRLRETIREELGEAYSPMANVSMTQGVDGMNYLMALSPGNRETSESVAILLREIGAKLAKEGVNQDELDRALKPMASDLDKTQRNNAYWLGSVLGGSTLNDWKFEAARNMKSDYSSITKEELTELAKTYLVPARCLPFAIRPSEEGLKKAAAGE